jgi:hypothetical protein
MDDVITFTAKRTATRKRCSVNVLDVNGQRTDRQKFVDLDLITTENAFAENAGIIPPEAGNPDLRLTGDHFS